MLMLNGGSDTPIFVYNMFIKIKIKINGRIY